jgi:hypothetical protein
MPSRSFSRLAYEAPAPPLLSSRLNCQSGVKLPTVLLNHSRSPAVQRRSITGASAGSAGLDYSFAEPDRSMNIPVASAAIGLVRLVLYVC